MYIYICIHIYIYIYIYVYTYIHKNTLFIIWRTLDFFLWIYWDALSPTPGIGQVEMSARFLLRHFGSPQKARDGLVVETDFG